MIRYFFSPLWQSIKNLKRNFWMAFASITSMFITLTLLGVVSAVLLNVEKVASNAEDKVQISVYLDYDSTDGAKEVTDLAGQTSANANYQKTSPDTFKSLEGDANPLQDVYYIKVSKDSQVKSVAKAIKKISGVEDVTYGGSDADQMISFLRGVRLWGIIGVIAFIIIAILLTSNTVRLTIRARKRDIEIMRLVGAKNSYIRGPFFFEGAWIGVFGAILPAIILYFGYQFVYKDLVSNYKGMVLYTPQEFLPYGIGGLFAFGIIIGAFASTLSMRRYLRT